MNFRNDKDRRDGRNFPLYAGHTLDSFGSINVAGESAIDAVAGDFYDGHLTDASGSVTVGGTAQTVLPLNTALNRRYLLIVNQGAEVLYVDFDQTATGPIAAVNAVYALDFVDSTGSGTFTITFNGITTAAITYSATAATLLANINTKLNLAFGTSQIVCSGSSLAALILTCSGTSYLGQPFAALPVVTLLSGATGFSATPSQTTAGVTASGGSIPLAAAGTAGNGTGGSKEYGLSGGFVPQGPLSVLGATTAHTFTVKSG